MTEFGFVDPYFLKIIVSYGAYEFQSVMFKIADIVPQEELRGDSIDGLVTTNTNSPAAFRAGSV